MGLTQEQLDILKLPFTPNDVLFKQTYIYAQEDAIADRIEMVDPSWTFERLSIEARDKYVTATFRLTICGVWRDGVGMELLSSNADPDKSAATDALKRAARLFGIGRYFQTLPSGVKDFKSYEEWYKKQFGSVGKSTQPPAPVPAQPPPVSAAPQVGNGASPLHWFIEGKHPSWFLNPIRDCWQVAKAYIADPRHGIYQNEIEMKNSFIKRGIVVDGKLVEIWGKMRAGEVIYCLLNRKVLDEFEVDWLTIQPADMAHTISYHMGISEKAS